MGYNSLFERDDAICPSVSLTLSPGLWFISRHLGSLVLLESQNTLPNVGKKTIVPPKLLEPPSPDLRVYVEM